MSKDIDKEVLIKRLKKIMEGVETDNFTRENLYYLIQDIENGKLNKRKED